VILFSRPRSSDDLLAIGIAVGIVVVGGISYLTIHIGDARGQRTLRVIIADAALLPQSICHRSWLRVVGIIRGTCGVASRTPISRCSEDSWRCGAAMYIKKSQPTKINLNRVAQVYSIYSHYHPLYSSKYFYVLTLHLMKLP